ncbi:glycosyltransferase [Pseudomonas tructae]|uniref:Glycosyltransferase n=1 Tax=Pseudomonas tructae TaxID=2518644 RepID=A0A411MMM4_9PSED|nr:glycosyltransferase family 2 protein [Pseudomonas tructae]QBF27920.1 glycosyltransferase [Pseudomonas tructae]
MSSYSPKLSVMIVTYNQVDLIGETIESVVSQGYPNLEVVVADDASTDGTQAVINEYQKKYPLQVKPVFNPINLGVTGNSNAAFNACTGELLAVLGGDDLFLPGKIQAQVALFEDPEVVLSYHSVEVFVHQTGEVLFTTNTTEKERVSDVYDLIAKCGIPGASSLMVRRSACPAYGFDTRFPVVSDWMFCIEVGLNGKIKELPGIYGKYRKHGLGASERTFELLDESLRTLDIIQARYPDDPKIRRACQAGAYRYLLGELYRQVVKKNPDKVRQLAPYFLAYSSGLKRLMTRIALAVLANKTFIGIVVGPLQKLKSTLKRNV